MSSPPFNKPSLCAGPLQWPVPRKAGSRWPQALIQDPRAAPCEGLRLGGPVILSWLAVVRESELAVARSTTPSSLSWNAWPARPRQAWLRHIVCPTSLRAFHRVPSNAAVRAYHLGTISREANGTALRIKMGSELWIGTTS